MAIVKVLDVPVFLELISGVSIMPMREKETTGTEIDWMGRDVLTNYWDSDYNLTFEESDNREVASDLLTTDAYFAFQGFVHPGTPTIIWSDSEAAIGYTKVYNNNANFFQLGVDNGGAGGPTGAITKWKDKARDLEALVTPGYPDFGNLAIDTIVVPIPEELRIEHGVSVADVEVKTATVIASNFSQIAHGLAKMAESLEIEVPEEPETESRDEYMAAAFGTITISPGVSSVTIEGTVPVYVDTDTDSAYAGPLSSSSTFVSGDDCIQPALASKEEHDKLVAAAVKMKADTGSSTVDVPTTRPEATVAECLSEEARSYFDKWWANAQATMDGVRSSSGPEGVDQSSLYQDYVDGGGTLSEADWLAERASDAVTWAEGTDTKNGSWIDTAIDGVSWLGSETMNLIRDWGPMGVSQVYATKKTTDAVVDGDIPWTTVLLIGGALLFLLR